ncbi:MAG: chorismate synthase [Paramuribaculum sp.]|nr:chorismate synthase [Paramuribaculum sp.]
MNNSIGNIYRLTSFGESHGPAIGGVIDGMPAGVAIDLDELQRQLDRRRPGQSDITTPRKEADRVKLLSGIFEGVTTGTSIGFIVENADHHSSDYDNMRHLFRPSHADYTYTAKYGIRDHRGGGRSSARETIARVVAGSLARQALATKGITISAYTSRIGDIATDRPYTELDLSLTDSNAVRCPDQEKAREMIELVRQVRNEGDTIGGIVSCVVKGCPAGLGDPVFGKLQARLASAMLGINAAKGFDYGMGFDFAGMRGSQAADLFTTSHADGSVSTLTNNSGGIQGGISNGMDIYFRVAFKPVATLLTEVPTIDDQGAPVTLKARGRHDPCVLPRAVPIVEAMAAMVIFDTLLANRCSRI